MGEPLTSQAAAKLAAPDAKRIPHVVTAPHGAQRNDDYYWLRDDARKNPEVIGYLEAENAYADEVLAPTKALQETLYQEIVARIKQDDASVPFRDKGWWYYARHEKGRDYPIHARRKDAQGIDAVSIMRANEAGDFADEQVLLDVNELAQGKDYYSVGDFEVSPDDCFLAYCDDDNGRRQYVIRFIDLQSGALLADTIAGASPNLVWADDGRTLFYVENDPETLLSVRVKKHVLGALADSDEVVHEEDDDSFYLGIGKTRDERFITIELASTVSSELRYAPADAPQDFVVLARRARDIEYDADHHGGRWLIRTNAGGAGNFKLAEAPSDATSRTQWKEVLAHDAEVFVEGFELFDDFIAVEERKDGLSRVRLLKGDGSQDFIALDEPAYAMGLATNSETGTDWLRYGYTSLTTPATTYELNVKTGERRTLKAQVVPGYDASDYVTERLWVDARDGTKVPLSLVYRKGFAKDGSAALLLYGYGSYGISIDPEFDEEAVSLLDRGMVYAIAHIRGGEELGRAWYEDGKLLNKMHTFTDFIDVAAALVAQGYAARDRIAAMGGSAGGLLMGAVANLSPATWRAIVSLVPFVDCVTTMLDPSIPLTTNEYDEWGNPEQKKFYDCMLRYSPYDNLAARDYPAIFVGAGLWDSQVQYWEPAKYVAKLRDVNTGRHPLVFRTNMDAGHGGKSGRFRRYRETAEQYAFLLDQLAILPA